MKTINDDFWKIISSNNRYDCKYNISSMVPWQNGNIWKLLIAVCSQIPCIPNQSQPKVGSKTILAGNKSWLFVLNLYFCQLPSKPNFFIFKQNHGIHSFSFVCHLSKVSALAESRFFFLLYWVPSGHFTGHFTGHFLMIWW